MLGCNLIINITLYLLYLPYSLVQIIPYIILYISTNFYVSCTISIFLYYFYMFVLFLCFCTFKTLSGTNNAPKYILYIIVYICITSIFLVSSPLSGTNNPHKYIPYIIVYICIKFMNEFCFRFYFY